MEASAKDWLDSLSAGTCDLNALLKGVTELLRKSPEEGWELLSIVDQYYRRGKISATVFAALKAHLQTLLMGKNSPEMSVPMPRSRNPVGAPPAASATTPVSVDTRPSATTLLRSTTAIPLLNEESATAPPAPTSEAAGPAAISVGSVLRNRYRVLGILGHGGTGTVFEAADLYRLDDERGHEKLAIKVLHPNVLRRPPLFAELRREFQRLQLLSHPNIVRVHEFDRDGETAFFTMEHLSGVLLSRVIAVRESVPVAREHALAMLRDIADALGYAHSRGVVHGDVSPGNIFICNDGELRVLDFGSNGVATPSFASCQVLDGEPPDASDDVYGLACIAYVLLAGVHPFQEQTALNARALNLTAKRPSGLSVSQWRALRAGLSWDRNRRPAEIMEWASLLNPRPPAHRLPALPTVMSAPASRNVSARGPALAALVLIILGCGWWVGTHLDSIQLAIGGVASKLAASRTAPSPSPAAPEPEAVAPAAATPVQSQSPSPSPSPPPPPPAVAAATAAMPPAVPLARASVTADRASVGSTPPLRVASNAPPAIAPAAGSPIAPTNPGFRARLELSSDNVEAVPADGQVRVLVRRTRSLRGEVSFSWWTESGTAKPGRDFSPVAMHVEQIADGKGAVTLVVPIIADPQRRQARNFYVVIDEASPSAAVGPRTLTMVTLPEPD